jgi:hypothetical protein
VTESGKNGPLRAALLGAALGFVANAAITVWSNYLTRRGQHVREADNCDELEAGAARESLDKSALR